MSRLHRTRADLLAVGLLFVLPLLWFLPVLAPGLSGLSLLPYDNLYSFEPWRTLQPDLRPYNDLLSDLVLENAVWKLHIRRSLAGFEIPLWNPQIFSGQPFMAAGQSSVFYPLSLLFYILPLEMAYGWFTALQIALAGANMYLFARTLRLRIPSALTSALIYMFSGFLIVSVVFTMFIAAVAWLPLLLAVIELILRKYEEKSGQAYNPIPYVAVGALSVGLLILAGHPELIYYTLLVAGAYAAVRLGSAWRKTRAPISNLPINLALWLLLMIGLGVALGAVQLLPLLELLPLNFRDGSASLQQVREWAWPSRHIFTFALPDFFGNPSHHRWYDIWDRQWVSADSNIFWGIKNYVEGGNYVGIGGWLLAAGAVVARLRRRRAQGSAQSTIVWFFVGLALISLLFAFGTPLYALLYYGLPGWNQLHSPFRWVFPFTLSMAVLAGFGMQELIGLASRSSAPITKEASDDRKLHRRPNFPTSILASLSMLAGLAALALVGFSLFQPAPFIAAGQQVVDRVTQAPWAFADGRMFWGYQALNLLRFGLFAVGSALLVLWISRTGRTALRLGPALLIALIVLDLWLAHGRFNPASPVALSPLSEAGVPPAVRFLNQRENPACDAQRIYCPPVAQSLWRFTTFEAPGEKSFQANVGMYYGWHDLRGYDSVIPRQYVDMMKRIAPQDEQLLYNRIAPLYSNAAADIYNILDNPILDLLNVKYVLTEHYIPNSHWQEVYRDEAIGIYENQRVLPRAFIADEARVAPAAEQPLLESDLRRVVFIEERPEEENAAVAASPQLAEAQISRYTSNSVFVDVNLSDRGWLVLADAWFPGWKAFIRPFGGDENQEQELRIYRADGALRTVYIPSDGQWTIRFVYSPMSFKLGLYVSFIALMTLLLLLLYWLWGRFYRPEAMSGDVRTAAKNSLVPMLLNLSNKAIDFAFAMLYVRLLGPEGTGKYYFVVAIYGFFEIVSRYGLGTLLTRDVAADKNQSSRYLTNVTALRTLLWLLSLPLLALVTWFYAGGDSASGIEQIGREEIQALALLAAAMLFANWSDGLSSTFHAFEKMEYTAGLASAMAILKVTLGAAVLLIGWGFVGLAGVSLAVNIIQMAALFWLLRVTLFKPEWRWDWSLQRWMVRTSGPLMLNHLLATIFWRIDVWILRRAANGAASIGLYSVGLKYVDGLNIIPSVFTMAVFPLISRYARNDDDSLLRAYLLSLRLLVMVSLPIAMTFTLLARPLAWLVGGGQFLDIAQTISIFGSEMTLSAGSDLALRVIIWSIPIGFVNSVTQFVLIAVNQQGYLTKAFILGVIFNITGNLLLIPHYGYLGAAFVTILSELSLLIPFYISVRRHVGVVPWLDIYIRPLGALLLMGAAIWFALGLDLNLAAAAVIGWFAYAIGLAATGALRAPDMDMMLQLLPGRKGT